MAQDARRALFKEGLETARPRHGQLRGRHGVSSARQGRCLGRAIKRALGPLIQFSRDGAQMVPGSVP